MFKKGDLVRVVRAFKVEVAELPMDYVTEVLKDQQFGYKYVLVKKANGEEAELLLDRFVIHVPKAAPERDYAIIPLKTEEVHVGMKLILWDIVARHARGNLVPILEPLLNKVVTVSHVGNAGSIRLVETGVQFVYCDRFKHIPAPIQAPEQAAPQVGDKLNVVLGKRDIGMRRGMTVTIRNLHVNRYGNTIYGLEEFKGGFKASRFEVVGKPVQAAVKAPEAVVAPPKPEWIPKVGDKVFITARVENAGKRHCYWDAGIGQGCMEKLVNNGVSYPIDMLTDTYINVNIQDGHRWEFLKECLTLDEGQPLPPKPPEPKPVKELPPKEDIRQFLKKKMIDGKHGSAICSYVMYLKDGSTKEWLSPPCYAYARSPVPIVEFATSLINHKEALSAPEMEIFKKWLHYLLNSSPWAACYIQKDVEEALENGISFDTSLPHSQIIGAAIAVREGHEYKGRLFTFNHMLERGYHGSVAYMISMNVKISKELAVGQVRCYTGHTALTDEAEDDEVISFFTKGFPDLKQKPCKEESGSYQIFNTATPSANKGATNDSFYKTVHKALKSKKTGQGFNEQIVTDIQSVYAYADTLQELF